MRMVLDEAVRAGFIKLFEAKADWQGAAKSLFVELTTAGLARARALGVEAAPSEITRRRPAWVQARTFEPDFCGRQRC